MLSEPLVQFSWLKSPQTWPTTAVGEVRVELGIGMKNDAYLLCFCSLGWLLTALATVLGN